MTDLEFSVKLTFLGMGIVFVALSLVAMAVTLFTWLETRRTAPSAAPAAMPTVEPGIPPEVVAAISAAVCASLGERTRVHRIRYRKGSPEATWARQGRISIMASHRIR